ncbi:MAG: hypothetical protein KF720_11915 [Rubrivivax sp.]|mgnify:CR=1 FL=1|nr:hypothetical protein [Rubrivivax sp.]
MLTERGWSWMLANQDKFALHKARASRLVHNAKPILALDEEDDIPF